MAATSEDIRIKRTYDTLIADADITYVESEHYSTYENTVKAWVLTGAIPDDIDRDAVQAYLDRDEEQDGKNFEYHSRTGMDSYNANESMKTLVRSGNLRSYWEKTFPKSNRSRDASIWSRWNAYYGGRRQIEDVPGWGGGTEPPEQRSPILYEGDDLARRAVVDYANARIAIANADGDLVEGNDLFDAWKDLQTATGLEIDDLRWWQHVTGETHEEGSQHDFDVNAGVNLIKQWMSQGHDE